MQDENWVFWLNVTNIGLAVVVFAALFAVAGGILRHLVFGHKRTSDAADTEGELRGVLDGMAAHSLHMPELGVTMADGGEPLEQSQPATEVQTPKQA